MKLLGTIITNDLKWNKNTKFLIKRAYARMELLRKLTSFTKSIKDRKHIYKSFIRSVLEQSCVVWGTSLTQENKDDLERTQTTFSKLVLRDTPEKRRQDLILKFA